MHSAASVVYPVARSRRAGWLVAAIWCFGLIPVMGWILLVPAPVLLKSGVALWAISVGLICLLGWWRAKPDFLAWDGKTWRTDDFAEACATVVLDFQSLILLRVDPYDARARWFFVDRVTSPVLWHGLRCALVASAHPAAGVSDTVPAA